MRVHDSQAYRKMDVTRERISRISREGGGERVGEKRNGIERRYRERERTHRVRERERVSWCFKPSQPQRIISGLRERERRGG